MDTGEKSSHKELFRKKRGQFDSLSCILSISLRAQEVCTDIPAHKCLKDVAAWPESPQ